MAALPNCPGEAGELVDEHQMQTEAASRDSRLPCYLYFSTLAGGLAAGEE